MTALERLESLCCAIPEAGCWIWLGATYTNGYGAFRYMGATRPAHRVSYELLIGPIPRGEFVLHRCDVPLCINPNHLFTGSQTDNMADCARKGRLRPPDQRGEKHSQAKLTLREAQSIRAIGRAATQRALAVEFGVDQKTIWDILHNRLWCY